MVASLGLGLLQAEPLVGEVPAGYSQQLKFSYRAGNGSERERRIFLWYPSAVEAAPFKYHGLQEGLVAPDAPLRTGRHPLVLFSHGFWGAADQTIFLMEALARAGYVVAALHHDDAIPNHRQNPVDLPNFVHAKAWDDAKFFDRKEDMSALLDHLLELDGREGSVLFEHLDRNTIGAAGHSLGGYTVLGMAGARASWEDERIRAALLLSPYVHPFYFHGNLKDVRIPVMFQGGTRDVGITPFLKSIYKRVAAPKYFFILDKVGHYGWTNFATAGQSTTQALQDGTIKLMADYGVAFFDRHLRGRNEVALKPAEAHLHRWWAQP